MEIKIFGGKKIKIRQISRKDLRNVKKFQDFINSLIEEDAQIMMNRKVSLREEKERLEERLKQIKNRKAISLVAECNNKVVGTTRIYLSKGRQSHVGNLVIMIRKGYRGIGLGNYLMDKIIKLVKRKLRPQPKFIRLSVLPTNKPSIGLYKKFGFKKVAKIPKQFEFKGKLVDEIVMLLDLP